MRFGDRITKKYQEVLIMKNEIKYLEHSTYRDASII